jgi:hypothetical protein
MNLVAALLLWRRVADDRHEAAALAAGSVGSLVLAAGLARTWSRHPERNTPLGPQSRTID